MSRHVSWFGGFHHVVPPETAFDEIERIRDRNGGVVTADDVLEASRDPSAPLHAEFTWDDSVAAEAHRRSQAGALIRHLRVEYVEAPGAIARAYSVTVEPPQPDPSARKFRSTEEMLEDPEERRKLLGRALSEAQSWRRRYQMLTELADVFTALELVT